MMVLLQQETPAVDAQDGLIQSMYSVMPYACCMHAMPGRPPCVAILVSLAQEVA